MENTKDKTFLLRVNEELKAKAEKKAKTDHRSLNSYILNLIEKDLKNSLISK
jgi:predicted HicB family RNase H-like nuclease